MTDLRFSRMVGVEQHNIYKEVDSLYDPLRKTLNPNNYHVPTQILGIGSKVSNEMRVLTPQELAELRQTTMIPVEDKLVPTHDLRPIQNSRMVAINAQTSVVGAPLTQEQIRQMFAGRTSKQEKIVYQMGNVQKHRETKISKPVPLDEETKVEVGPKAGKYEPNMDDINRPTKAGAGGVGDYKYNFYSMIDEPVNRVIDGGCNFGLCSMPDNEVVARRKVTRDSWADW